MSHLTGEGAVGELLDGEAARPRIRRSTKRHCRTFSPTPTATRTPPPRRGDGALLATRPRLGDATRAYRRANGTLVDSHMRTCAGGVPAPKLLERIGFVGDPAITPPPQ